MFALLFALALACAKHPTNNARVPPETMRLVDIPTGPCAFPTSYHTHAYSRPQASDKYRFLLLNWGAFPVIEDSVVDAEGNRWLTVADFSDALPGRAHIIFVLRSAMTFDLSDSTMSVGDAAETDWSHCSNAPSSQ